MSRGVTDSLIRMDATTLAGPPPWHVYRLTPGAAAAAGTVAPGGATRWRF
jgi:hypothetical protein